MRSAAPAAFSAREDCLAGIEDFKAAKISLHAIGVKEVGAWGRCRTLGLAGLGADLLRSDGALRAH